MIVEGLPVRVTVTAVALPAVPEAGDGADAEIAQAPPEPVAVKVIADEVKPVTVFLTWNVIAPATVEQILSVSDCGLPSVVPVMLTVGNPLPVTLTIVAAAGIPRREESRSREGRRVADPTGPEVGLSAPVIGGAFVDGERNRVRDAARRVDSGSRTSRWTPSRSE